MASDQVLRETLQEQTRRLEQVLQIFGNLPNYVHDQNVYSNVASVINFIKEHVNNFETDPLLNNSLKKLVFMVGETGAGKSTLLNYIALGEGSLKIKNSDGQITTRDRSVAEIGGDISTTLIPNLYENYLDCAGEGDVGGIIVEIINSFVKLRIAQNTQQAKVIFVTKYDGLKSGGAYGMAFKLALDKNAQFIGNLSHLQDNICFVITRAGCDENSLSNAFAALKQIENHGNMTKYSGILKKIINNNYIQIFCRPHKNLEENDTYAPPNWNKDQRQKIIEMIDKVPFGKIPSKDFFNVSSSPEVRETMQKAVEIVEAKAMDLICQAVKSSMPFNIFSVELKPFDKYIKGLITGVSANLIHYFKILSWNNYLKVNIDQKVLNQVNEELEFLSKFANQGASKQKSCIKNWSSLELKKIFSDLGSEVAEILASSGHNFSKFWKGKNLNTNSTSNDKASAITSRVKLLYEKYKEMSDLKILENNQKSIYFQDSVHKEFSHKEQVSYQQNQKYVEEEEYIDTEHKIESYQEQQTKVKMVTKTKKQKYNANAGQVKTIVDKIPYSKIVNANEGKTRTAYEVRSKNVFFGLFSKTYEVSRQVPLEPDWRTQQLFKESIRVVDQQPDWKEKDVSYNQAEQYQKMVTKEKLVPTQVTKVKPVAKQREVTKCRQQDRYKDLIVPQFDPSKFKEDFDKCSDGISVLRSEIEGQIQGYQKGKQGIFMKQSIVARDQYEQQFKDLLEKWQDGEYGCYFFINENNSLQDLQIQDIAREVKKESQFFIKKGNCLQDLQIEEDKQLQDVQIQDIASEVKR